MNREKLVELLERYEQGLSSREEENILMKHAGLSHKAAGAWFKFLKHQKRIASDDLEMRVQDAIKSFEKGKIRFIKRISLAAASAALLVSILFISLPWQDRAMSYEEKAAVLQEALSLLEEGRQEPGKKVIYEDSLIIIYTE